MDEAEYEVIETEVNYHRFKILLDNNDVHEAYEVFKKDPRLITHVRLWEFSVDYEEIRTKVGARESSYFGAAFVREIIGILQTEIPMINLHAEYREEKTLEQFLNGLSDKAKKNLEEMGEDEK